MSANHYQFRIKHPAVSRQPSTCGSREATSRFLVSGRFAGSLQELRRTPDRAPRPEPAGSRDCTVLSLFGSAIEPSAAKLYVINCREQGIALINPTPKALSRTLLVPSLIGQRDEHDDRDQSILVSRYIAGAHLWLRSFSPPRPQHPPCCSQKTSPTSGDYLNSRSHRRGSHVTSTSNT
jgi:hypothetical protein